MSNHLTPEQLRQNAAAMLAFADGKPVEAYLASTGQWYPAIRPCWDFELWQYRPAPDPIAPGHNPDKLLVSQVGEGWRLLDEDEVKEREALIMQIENWMKSGWNDTGWVGNFKTNTYRTRLTREELAALDKPAKCQHGSVVIGIQSAHCRQCGVDLFKHEDAPYWREEKPGWQLPAPPAGQQWHRDDFTEADLSPGWRPLLKGELAKSGDHYRHEQSKSWTQQGHDDLTVMESVLGMFVKTRRQLPSAPKIVPWDFETAPIKLKVKTKRDGRDAIACVMPNGFNVFYSTRAGDEAEHSFTSLLENFTQLDGSPCGTTK